MMLDFLSFADLNAYGYDELHGLKEHQHVTYLTEKNEKALINILQYDTFGSDFNFTLYKRSK